MVKFESYKKPVSPNGTSLFLIFLIYIGLSITYSYNQEFGIKTPSSDTGIFVTLLIISVPFLFNPLLNDNEFCKEYLPKDLNPNSDENAAVRFVKKFFASYYILILFPFLKLQSYIWSDRNKTDLAKYKYSQYFNYYVVPFVGFVILIAAISIAIYFNQNVINATNSAGIYYMNPTQRTTYQVIFSLLLFTIFFSLIPFKMAEALDKTWNYYLMFFFSVVNMIIINGQLNSAGTYRKNVLTAVYTITIIMLLYSVYNLIYLSSESKDYRILTLGKLSDEDRININPDLYAAYNVVRSIKEDDNKDKYFENSYFSVEKAKKHFTNVDESVLNSLSGGTVNGFNTTLKTIDQTFINIYQARMSWEKSLRSYFKAKGDDKKAIIDGFFESSDFNKLITQSPSTTLKNNAEAFREAWRKSRASNQLPPADVSQKIFSVATTVIGGNITMGAVTGLLLKDINTDVDKKIEILFNRYMFNELSKAFVNVSNLMKNFIIYSPDNDYQTSDISTFTASQGGDITILNNVKDFYKDFNNLLLDLVNARIKIENERNSKAVVNKNLNIFQNSLTTFNNVSGFDNNFDDVIFSYYSDLRFRISILIAIYNYHITNPATDDAERKKLITKYRERINKLYMISKEAIQMIYNKYGNDDIPQLSWPYLKNLNFSNQGLELTPLADNIFPIIISTPGMLDEATNLYTTAYRNLENGIRVGGGRTAGFRNAQAAAGGAGGATPQQIGTAAAAALGAGIEPSVRINTAVTAAVTAAAGATLEDQAIIAGEVAGLEMAFSPGFTLDSPKVQKEILKAVSKILAVSPDGQPLLINNNVNNRVSFNLIKPLENTTTDITDSVEDLSNKLREQDNKTLFNLPEMIFDNELLKTQMGGNDNFNIAYNNVLIVYNQLVITLYEKLNERLNIVKDNIETRNAGNNDIRRLITDGIIPIEQNISNVNNAGGPGKVDMRNRIAAAAGPPFNQEITNDTEIYRFYEIINPAVANPNFDNLQNNFLSSYNTVSSSIKTFEKNFNERRGISSKLPSFLQNTSSINNNIKFFDDIPDFPPVNLPLNDFEDKVFYKFNNTTNKIKLTLDANFVNEFRKFLQTIKVRKDKIFEALNEKQKNNIAKNDRFVKIYKYYFPLNNVEGANSVEQLYLKFRQIYESYLKSIAGYLLGGDITERNINKNTTLSLKNELEIINEGFPDEDILKTDVYNLYEKGQLNTINEFGRLETANYEEFYNNLLSSEQISREVTRASEERTKKYEEDIKKERLEVNSEMNSIFIKLVTLLTTGSNDNISLGGKNILKINFTNKDKNINRKVFNVFTNIILKVITFMDFDNDKDKVDYVNKQGNIYSVVPYLTVLLANYFMITYPNDAGAAAVNNSRIRRGTQPIPGAGANPGPNVGHYAAPNPNTAYDKLITVLNLSVAQQINNNLNTNSVFSANGAGVGAAAAAPTNTNGDSALAFLTEATADLNQVLYKQKNNIISEWLTEIEKLLHENLNDFIYNIATDANSTANNGNVSKELNKMSNEAVLTNNIYYLMLNRIISKMNDFKDEKETLLFVKDMPGVNAELDYRKYLNDFFEKDIDKETLIKLLTSDFETRYQADPTNPKQTLIKTIVENPIINGLKIISEI